MTPAPTGGNSAGSGFEICIVGSSVRLSSHVDEASSAKPSEDVITR